MEFCCVFGISSSVTDLKPGEQITKMNSGYSILAVGARDKRAFWFVVKKLDRKYYSHFPRFSSNDADIICEDMQSDILRSGITFSKLWERREFCSVTGLEEGLYRTCHFDRIVCLGDSTIKVCCSLCQAYSTYSPVLLYS